MKILSKSEQNSGKKHHKVGHYFYWRGRKTLIWFCTRSLALKLRVTKIYNLRLQNLTQDNKKGEKALKGILWTLWYLFHLIFEVIYKEVNFFVKSVTPVLLISYIETRLQPSRLKWTIDCYEQSILSIPNGHLLHKSTSI